MSRKDETPKMPQKKVSIIDLPTELIEIICAWLVHPFHDAILDLRLANKTLAEKSSHFFGQMFFEHTQFTLASMKHHYSILREIQKSKFAEFVKEVQLSAGIINIPVVPHGMQYQNFFRAKGIDPVAFAKVLSELPSLLLIIFGGFRAHGCHGISSNLLREVGPTFMGMMAENLYAPKLKGIVFERIEIKKNDVVALVKKHKKTLQSVEFDQVLVANGTWTPILRTLGVVKGLNHINISCPAERRPQRISEVSFTPPDYYPPDFDDIWSDIESEFDANEVLREQLEEMSLRDEWADWHMLEWIPDPHTLDHPRSWTCGDSELIEAFLTDLRDRYHIDYF